MSMTEIIFHFLLSSNNKIFSIRWANKTINIRQVSDICLLTLPVYYCLIEKSSFRDNLKFILLCSMVRFDLGKLFAKPLSFKSDVLPPNVLQQLRGAIHE